MIGKEFNCYFAKICDNQNKNVMQYGITDYDCELCKVNILKYIFDPLKSFNTRYIKNNDNKTLVQTKFDNYYELMYPPDKTPRYSVLWKERKVYN